MKVVVSARAERDLLEVEDWLFELDHPNPLKVISDLRTAALSLGKHPYLHSVRALYKDLELRRRNRGNYGIFYRVDEERGELVIEHILHGARDLDAFFERPATDD